MHSRRRATYDAFASALVSRALEESPIMTAPTSLLVTRMLAVMRNEVLPLTREGVRHGNKVFGAAVLLEESLELVAAGTNQETKNPLFHGEISCLNSFWSLSSESRPLPEECLLLSSHEPCSMCLSAIAWSGFRSFYYLFSYEDTRDEFEIPHDLAILAEVFGCSDGAYAPANAYWNSYYLVDLVEKGSPSERVIWREQIAELRSAYDELSSSYQARKQQSDIPLR
jgi:tRNA(Arg) A34 adenosine deaminase TadA